MAPKQQRAARQKASDVTPKADPGADENGHEEEVARDEKELAGYLQERLKPGLNSGAIPLLARSIAKEIAHQEYGNGGADDEGSDELTAETADLGANLQELQAKLGEDWVLYFAVHGEDTWLTAETEDASQRIEAPSASVLIKAVEVLNEGGGRGGAS
jgi:hypothetical protein